MIKLFVLLLLVSCCPQNRDETTQTDRDFPSTSKFGSATSAPERK